MNDATDDETCALNYVATINGLGLTKDNAAGLQAVQTMTCLKTGADFVQRKIYLMGEINDTAAYHFLVPFSVMDATPGDITVILMSNGGHEDAGYAIFDAITHSKNKVEIVGIGGVYSIAAAIFQAGDVRSLYSEARFMVHNGSLEMDANIPQDSVIALGKEVEKGNKKYQTILANRSGNSLAQIKELCAAETFYSADEAVKSGFADRVLKASHPTPVAKKRKK